MTATGSVPAGTRVGRYEIVSLLRQGGMGEVYSAEDSQLGRRVALKILPKHRTSDPERVARFVREVRASATLNHPSIVAVHDAGSDGDVHFLAMELIDGQPLSEWMRKRRSIASRVELMAQVAEGLARAHDSGIVHRDLKPDNVMVTADGRAKIVDFGIAKLTERIGERTAATGTTTPTSRVGTTAYMSPEQIEGKLLDRRTDVFSFGTVLYELLTGTNPFSAAQYADTLHNVAHHEPPMDRIPLPLRRVVQRCLRKDPALRYDSLRDAALDLREALEEVAPAAPRKRRVWIAAAIVLLAIAGAAAWWLSRGAPEKSEQSGMMMTRLTHSGRVMTAAISPDGKYLVHAVREGDGEALYVKQIATGTVTKIAESALRFHYDLSVSPDGNYAYYAVAERSEPNVVAIEQLPLLGGTPRRIAEDTEAWYSLSPDGTRVVFRRFSVITRESAVTVAAVDGSGEQVVLRRKRPEYLDRPVWTPDGAAITLVSGSVTRRGALYRLNLATGDLSPVPTPKFPGVDSYAWLPDGSGMLVCVYEREQPPQIWFVPEGGTAARKITSEVSAYYGVKPTADSRTFSVVREVTDSNIYLTTLDGKPERALTSGVGNWVGGGAGGVRWLSEGQVAFSSHANGMNTFYAVDLNGGAPRRLIQNMQVRGLVVSPDGRRIAFVSDKSGTPEIWIADAAGTNARQLTHDSNSSWPSFTPDGKSVVHLGFAEGQHVWSTPVEGKTRPVRITQVPSNRPSVSPDGKWLLCRLRSTTPGVPLWRTAIVPMNGNGEPRYFPSPRNGDAPVTQWHPNGHAFLYSDVVGEVANIWIQDIDGSEPRQLTHFASGEIFSFDLAPDGNRLVITRGQSSSDAMLIRDFR